MGKISNFPASLQPIIQQGFLHREFQQALTSRIGFRAVARRAASACDIGDVGTARWKDNAGRDLRADYTLNHYAATTDLNMVTSRVGIASQFLLNTAINGEQAARSLEELSRHALWAAYKDAPRLRPGKATCGASLGSESILTMSVLLDGVAQLRQANAPDVDGVYNCYLDPLSARQLFRDADFRALFTGATSANQVFRQGMVNDFLGLRFIPVTEFRVEAHPSIPTFLLRRPIIVGADALCEVSMMDMVAADVAPADALIEIVDGVAMVTCEPIDRLQQIIAQSWYWIGGYGATYEIVDERRVFNRAVVLEHVG